VKVPSSPRLKLNRARGRGAARQACARAGAGRAKARPRARARGGRALGERGAARGRPFWPGRPAAPPPDPPPESLILVTPTCPSPLGSPRRYIRPASDETTDICSSTLAPYSCSSRCPGPMSLAVVLAPVTSPTLVLVLAPNPRLLQSSQEWLSARSVYPSPSSSRTRSSSSRTPSSAGEGARSTRS
jgi:hypothetical protein